jgi:hypothetical protein
MINEITEDGSLAKPVEVQVLPGYQLTILQTLLLEREMNRKIVIFHV